MSEVYVKEEKKRILVYKNIRQFQENEMQIACKGILVVIDTINHYHKNHFRIIFSSNKFSHSDFYMLKKDEDWEFVEKMFNKFATSEVIPVLYFAFEDGSFYLTEDFCTKIFIKEYEK